jgi:prepilin-type processing-associated H-X9-DG protein
MFRRGASFIEVAVVVGIIAVLIGILIPTAQAVRHKSYVTQCGANLEQIGQALRRYVIENRGLPRTAFVPGAALTGIAVLGETTPLDDQLANDATSAVELLQQSQRLSADMFACPFSEVETASSAGTTPDGRKNTRHPLGYSFASPYPETGKTLRPSRILTHSFVLAADINPGIKGQGDDAAVRVVDGTTPDLRMANSRNHGKTGQNVLFGDGHVEWTTTVLCGPFNDNIYANRRGEVSRGPVDDFDAVLMPTDDE